MSYNPYEPRLRPVPARRSLSNKNLVVTGILLLVGGCAVALWEFVQPNPYNTCFLHPLVGGIATIAAFIGFMFVITGADNRILIAFFVCLGSITTVAASLVLLSMEGISQGDLQYPLLIFAIGAGFFFAAALVWFFGRSGKNSGPETMKSP